MASGLGSQDPHSVADKLPTQIYIKNEDGAYRRVNTASKRFMTVPSKWVRA